MPFIRYQLIAVTLTYATLRYRARLRHAAYVVYDDITTLD